MRFFILDHFSRHAIHLNNWSEIPRPPLTIYDLDRQTKANTVIETLSAKERSRYDNAANTLRIALAKKHGEALHDISMERAVALAIFEPDMLEVVYSEAILSKSQVKAVLGAVERDEIIQRKPFRLATTAMANKAARIIWAMLTKKQEYRQPAF